MPRNRLYPQVSMRQRSILSLHEYQFDRQTRQTDDCAIIKAFYSATDFVKQSKNLDNGSREKLVWQIDTCTLRAHKSSSDFSKYRAVIGKLFQVKGKNVLIGNQGLDLSIAHNYKRLIFTFIVFWSDLYVNYRVTHGFCEVLLSIAVVILFRDRKDACEHQRKQHKGDNLKQRVNKEIYLISF